MNVLQGDFRQAGLLPVSDGAYSLPVGVWTHVAMAFDGIAGIARLYVNGVQIAEESSGIVGLLSDRKFHAFCGRLWLRWP